MGNMSLYFLSFKMSKMIVFQGFLFNYRSQEEKDVNQIDKEII